MLVIETLQFERGDMIVTRDLRPRSSGGSMKHLRYRNSLSAIRIGMADCRKGAGWFGGLPIQRWDVGDTEYLNCFAGKGCEVGGEHCSDRPISEVIFESQLGVPVAR